MEYEEFPKTMAHPAFKKSIALPVPGTEIKNAQGEVVSRSYQGTPEMFPPVTVEDATMEEYYAAQGYLPAGHIDPAAYVERLSDPVAANYTPAEYPKWVDGVLINSAEEDATRADQREPNLPPAQYRAEVIEPETIEQLEARLKAMKAALPGESKSDKAKRAWATRKANQLQAQEA